MLQKYRQILIRTFFMLIIPLISMIHIALNVYRDNTKEISTALDSLIPFLSPFVIPYVYWFLYVFVGLLYLAVTDGRKYFGLLFSIVSGMLVSFVIFYFYPTTVERPEIIGQGFFNYAMRIVYGSDNPYNCFPSIHVLNATLVTLFLMSREKSMKYNLWALISCILINLSTLFVKQHVVLDLVAGVTLAVIMYMLWSNDKVWQIKFFKYLDGELNEENNTQDNPNVT